MNNGTCTIPCYEEEENCHLTVVKIFLAKYSDSKIDPPVLYKLNPIMWHGLLRPCVCFHCDGEKYLCLFR